MKKQKKLEKILLRNSKILLIQFQIITNKTYKTFTKYNYYIKKFK